MASWKNELVRPTTWTLLDFSRKFSFSTGKVILGLGPPYSYILASGQCQGTKDGMQA